MSDVMRAVGITRFGGPEVLQIVERPVPEPGPGEVRIRVAAATVNPTDTVLRSGRHGAPDGLEPPYVPGMELAGPPALPAVRDGGQLAAVRPFRGETERSVTVILVWVGDYLHEQGKLAGLAALAAAGRITLRVARTLPAEQAAQAHRLLEAGGVRGRLVLTF